MAGVEAGRGKAVAYQGGRKYLESEGVDPAAALEQLTRLIDDIHEHREASRMGSEPTALEYADALQRVDRFVNATEQAALIRHAARPGARATLGQLASQFRVAPEAMQRGYAKLGRYLGDVLNFRPEQDNLAKALQPLLVLAEPHGEPSEDVEWALRESLVEAIGSWGPTAPAT